MNINPKRYREKSPEAIALESTIAHYLLFYHPDPDYVVAHDARQQLIDYELAAVAILLSEEEKVKQYVT